MNFKKLVCLTIAFAMAFAPVVGAADTDICANCKSPINVLEFDHDQGACENISYEPQTYDGVKTRHGYTGKSDNTTAKLIMKVCNCPNTAANFKLNSIIGIRMTILTDGVYWTDDPMGIQPFASEADACATNVPRPGRLGPYVNTLPDVVYDLATGKVDDDNKGKIYLPPMHMIDGATIPAEGYYNQGYWTYDELTDTWGHTNQDIIGALVTNLGRYPANYLTKRTNDVVDYTYYKADGTTKLTKANILAATRYNQTCTVAANARAKVVEVKGAYQIGILDQEFALSYWWVDIPLMVKDYTEVVAASPLQVKIELLSDSAGGVCASCKTICECIFTLGNFGDDVMTVYFPYVFTNIAPWTTGIAITNLDTAVTPIGNMEATFTLTDSTGKTFTYRKTDFQASVMSVMLDSIVDKFDGTPKDGAAWLKVDSNFKIDGYQFVTDGVYGAGTLPRLPGITGQPVN